MREKCGMKEEYVMKGVSVVKEECAMYGKDVL